jgi:hypothetical protein
LLFVIIYVSVAVMKAIVILNNRRSGKVVARTEDVRFITFQPLAPYEISFGDIISHLDFLQVGIQKYRSITNRQSMAVNVQNIGSSFSETEEPGFLWQLISKWLKRHHYSDNRPVSQDKSSPD